MSHLINIFVEPGKVFAELKEKPTFLLPMALMIVLSAAMVLLYFNKVDSDWSIEHQLAMSGKEMTANEIEQSKSVMPSAPVMGVIGAVFGTIFIAIVFVVMALYYMLAGKISGVAVSFKHGLSLVSWAGLPSQLGLIVAIVGVLMMQPQTGLESLALTRLDPLLVQLPPDHAWSTFAKNFDLLTLWTVALAAIGWRTWGKTSWGQAITVAIIPSLIIYGGMAAWAMMKS
jgi:Yip1 domain